MAALICSGFSFQRDNVTDKKSITLAFRAFDQSNENLIIPKDEYTLHVKCFHVVRSAACKMLAKLRWNKVICLSNHQIHSKL